MQRVMQGTASRLLAFMEPRTRHLYKNMQKVTQGTASCLLAFIEVATSFHVAVTFPILTSGLTNPHKWCAKAEDTSPLQEHAEGHAGYCFAPHIHGSRAVAIISLTSFTSLSHSPITTHSVSTTPPYTNGVPKPRTRHLCKNMQKATQGAALRLIAFIEVDRLLPLTPPHSGSTTSPYTPELVSSFSFLCCQTANATSTTRLHPNVTACHNTTASNYLGEF
ncbi:hypothetical protein EI94DRAFT_1709678 [Lactarius quietus]|nr:hypothetical protein EI94DRAFT_1709678 [Lactarius quietus]